MFLKGSVVSDFWRDPDALHDAPAGLLGEPRRRAFRPNGVQARNTPGTLQDCAPPAKRRAETQIQPAAQNALIDTCMNAPNRVGCCRMRECGRIVAVPPLPCAYSKDLDDSEHELLVVEMKAAVGAEHVAWLDDEEVDEVLLRLHDGNCYILRTALKLYVMRNVSLTKPTRTLSRALHKMCSPLGAEGPIVTLLQVRDLMSQVTPTSLRRSEGA